MSYNVYTAEYFSKPNHVAIYIETNPNVLQVADWGHLHHVTGNILQGMKYDPRDSRVKNQDRNHRQAWLGQVRNGVL